MIRTRRSQQNSPKSNGSPKGFGVRSPCSDSSSGQHHEESSSSSPRTSAADSSSSSSSSSSSLLLRSLLFRSSLRRRGNSRTKRAHQLTLAVSFVLLCGAGCVLFRCCQPRYDSTTSTTTSRQATLLRQSSDKFDGLSLFQVESVGAPSCATFMSVNDVDFTLVTQCSEDRLWMMQHQCQHWPGPISIAVYTNSTVHEIEKVLDSFGCHGTQIVVQTLAADRPVEDFPVNELRNKAFAAVQTSHVVYIDVDFWISANLYNLLHMPQHRERLRDNPKLALVLPAFALKRQCREYKECPSKNIPLMPLTKNRLMESLLNRTVTAFDPTNYGGHGSTHYYEWMDQEDDQLEEISCVASNRYEPYLVVRYCRDLPPFQTQFTGYGKNKMTWIMQLRRSGYRLAQINGFVCHYPHLDSGSRIAWNGNNAAGIPLRKKPKSGEFDKYKRARNDELFLRFRDWLQKSGSVPDQTIVGLCKDHADDDSKLWVDRPSNSGGGGGTPAASSSGSTSSGE